MITRIVLPALALGFAAAAVPASAGPVSIAVPYSDLDLTREEGRKALDPAAGARRTHRVCGERPVRNLALAETLQVLPARKARASYAPQVELALNQRQCPAVWRCWRTSWACSPASDVLPEAVGGGFPEKQRRPPPTMSAIGDANLRCRRFWQAPRRHRPYPRGPAPRPCGGRGGSRGFAENPHIDLRRKRQCLGQPFEGEIIAVTVGKDHGRGGGASGDILRHRQPEDGAGVQVEFVQVLRGERYQSRCRAGRAKARKKITSSVPSLYLATKNSTP